jgi:hypothetical protein
MDSGLKFFETDLQLVQGQGDLKTALGNMLPIVAQLANSAGASPFVTDEAQQVLNPLVTFGLPEPYVILCGKIPIGERCCGRAAIVKAAKKRWAKVRAQAKRVAG